MYVVLPSTRANLEKAAGNFEKKFGFLKVTGCVDGTHIPIIQPKSNLHDYFCNKMNELPSSVKLKIAVKLVYSCFILHNFCECNSRYTA